jgi:hypothetical protein
MSYTQLVRGTFSKLQQAGLSLGLYQKRAFLEVRRPAHGSLQSQFLFIFWRSDLGFGLLGSIRNVASNVEHQALKIEAHHRQAVISHL